MQRGIYTLGFPWPLFLQLDSFHWNVDQRWFKFYLKNAILFLMRLILHAGAVGDPSDNWQPCIWLTIWLRSTTHIPHKRRLWPHVLTCFRVKNGGKSCTSLQAFDFLFFGSYEWMDKMHNNGVEQEARSSKKDNDLTSRKKHLHHLCWKPEYQHIIRTFDCLVWQMKQQGCKFSSHPSRWDRDCVASLSPTFV